MTIRVASLVGSTGDALHVRPLVQKQRLVTVTEPRQVLKPRQVDRRRSGGVSNML